MTCTSAIVLGNTRKAWVGDARGNTWSGKCAKEIGCRVKAIDGGFSAIRSKTNARALMDTIKT